MINSLLAFGWFPDNPQDWIFEVIGIVASLFVFASFFWTDAKITRIVNMVGCVIFVIYSVLIKSLSVCVINSACFILHIVKLVQMYLRAKNEKSVNDKAEQETTEQPHKE